MDEVIVKLNSLGIEVLTAKSMRRKLDLKDVLEKLARVYNNQHWFSDVFLGSAIG